MSENPNKTKVISLRLSDENEKILQGIEEATGKSKSDLMEDYLQEDWKRNRNKYNQILSLQKRVK
jgi:predicted transcriptional regulator